MHDGVLLLSEHFLKRPACHFKRGAVDERNAPVRVQAVNAVRGLLQKQPAHLLHLEILLVLSGQGRFGIGGAFEMRNLLFAGRGMRTFG